MGFRMAYKLRIQRSDRLYLVTTRCVGAQHLMRPDAECCRIILACLSRFAVAHKVDVYGFVFMSNHYHLLCGAPHLNLSAFLQDLNSSIARRLNVHRDRNGVFFGERYTTVDVLDDEKAFEKLLYILVNPCAAGVVVKPGEYPGVSSYAYHLSGEKVRGHWVDRKRYHRNRKRNPEVRKEDYTAEYEFALKPLPQMQSLSHEERALRIEKAILKRCKALQRERKKDGKSRYLGPKKCRELDPFSAPERPKKTRYSACVGTDREAVLEYNEQRRAVVEAYRKARKLDCRAVREKVVSGICYPPGTIPPGCRRCVPYGEEKSGV